MPRLFWLALIPLLLLFLGCSPGVSREDLGEVLKELPKVPGSETPYDMSDELGPPLPQDPDKNRPL